MKKIFTVLMLCFVSVCSFGQIEQYKQITNFDLSMHNTQKPKSIQENWQIGNNCYVAGACMISVGIISSAIGTLLYCTNMNEHGNVKTLNVGIGFISAGSTLVGVSIPLLCFGDHIERETTMINDVWNSLVYKNENKK